MSDDKYVFKTTLFKLLNAANQVIIDGYEPDSVYFEYGGTVLRCALDDMLWLFPNQEVMVDYGACTANLLPDDDGAVHQVGLVFYVSRAIALDDIE